jgi:hypothetical protein
MKSGRDFFSVDDALAEDIASAFAAEVQWRLDAQARLMVGVSALKAVRFYLHEYSRCH